MRNNSQCQAKLRAQEAFVALCLLRTVGRKCWWVMLANLPAFSSKDFWKLCITLMFCLQAPFTCSWKQVWLYSSGIFPWVSPLDRADQELCSRHSAWIQPTLCSHGLILPIHVALLRSSQPVSCPDKVNNFFFSLQFVQASLYSLYRLEFSCWWIVCSPKCFWSYKC